VRDGHIVRLSPGQEIPFPETVQALIAARLDLLPLERKALVQDAAVVGKVFLESLAAYCQRIPGTGHQREDKHGHPWP
jgi:hypothetical protein